MSICGPRAMLGDGMRERPAWCGRLSGADDGGVGVSRGEGALCEWSGGWLLLFAAFVAGADMRGARERRWGIRCRP